MSESAGWLVTWMSPLLREDARTLQGFTEPGEVRDGSPGGQGMSIEPMTDDSGQCPGVLLHGGICGVNGRLIKRSILFGLCERGVGRRRELSHDAEDLATPPDVCAEIHRRRLIAGTFEQIGRAAPRTGQLLVIGLCDLGVRVGGQIQRVAAG